MSDNRAWFAPKRFGYGAGLPIAWQGWALMIVYLLVIVLAGLLIRYTVIGYISVLAILTIPFLTIVARTTRGGWRWRWGRED